MGMTYSWYYVKNSGQTPEFIRSWLSAVLKRQSDFILKMQSDLMENIRGMAAEWLDRLPPEQREIFASMPSMSSPRPSDLAYAAYKPDAAFFPVFAASICDGYNASSRDCAELSEFFHAPVFALSVFDSDVAFASFHGGESGGHGDYVRAPEGYEEYDEELYSPDFPEFLLKLCPPESQEKVRSIWENPDYVFADDKVAQITEIIGLPQLLSEYPDRGLRLEGWEIIDSE